MSTDDSLERAKEWMDALEPTVPLDRLPDAFAQALSDHETTFPINYFDLNAAWKKIVAVESLARAEELRRQMEENPIGMCKDKALHVSEDGEVSYVDPTDTRKDIILPCKSCRPDAWIAARDRHIAKQPHRKPLEIVQDFVPPIPPQLIIPQTPAEEATAARVHIKKLMDNPNLTQQQYDDYQRAYDQWGEILLEIIGGDSDRAA